MMGINHQSALTWFSFYCNPCCVCVGVCVCVCVFFNPCLTKLFFVTRLTKSYQGGLLQPHFPNRCPYEIVKLILVSIGRYGPSLSIHTKMSTIGQGVT